MYRRPADRKKYITHKLLQSYTEIMYKIHSQKHIHKKETQTSKKSHHTHLTVTHICDAQALHHWSSMHNTFDFTPYIRKTL